MDFVFIFSLCIFYVDFVFFTCSIAFNNYIFQGGRTMRLDSFEYTASVICSVLVTTGGWIMLRLFCELVRVLQ